MLQMLNWQLIHNNRKDHCWKAKKKQKTKKEKMVYKCLGCGNCVAGYPESCPIKKQTKIKLLESGKMCEPCWAISQLHLLASAKHNHEYGRDVSYLLFSEQDESYSSDSEEDSDVDTFVAAGPIPSGSCSSSSDDMVIIKELQQQEKVSSIQSTTVTVREKEKKKLEHNVRRLLVKEYPHTKCWKELTKFLEYFGGCHEYKTEAELETFKQIVDEIPEEQLAAAYQKKISDYISRSVGSGDDRHLFCQGEMNCYDRDVVLGLRTSCQNQEEVKDLVSHFMTCSKNCPKDVINLISAFWYTPTVIYVSAQFSEPYSLKLNPIIFGFDIHRHSELAELLLKQEIPIKAKYAITRTGKKYQQAIDEIYRQLLQLAKQNGWRSKKTQMTERAKNIYSSLSVNPDYFSFQDLHDDDSKEKEAVTTENKSENDEPEKQRHSDDQNWFDRSYGRRRPNRKKVQRKQLVSFLSKARTHNTKLILSATLKEWTAHQYRDVVAEEIYCQFCFKQQKSKELFNRAFLALDKSAPYIGNVFTVADRQRIAAEARKFSAPKVCTSNSMDQDLPRVLRMDDESCAAWKKKLAMYDRVYWKSTILGASRKV